MDAKKGPEEQSVQWNDDDANKSKDSTDESDIESLKCFAEESSPSDFREPDAFLKIIRKIEKEITEMGVVINELNKMREQAASLEADLVSKLDIATWDNVSELIGMSSTTIIDECMKILYHADGAEDVEWTDLPINN